MLSGAVCMSDAPVLTLEWGTSYRIIPTLFPERTFFDEVCSEDELEYVYYIESLTNKRIADEIGDTSKVPKDEWVLGKGSTPIMAAFTHVKASRFNTDYFGAYYASKELKTAIYETVYHRERFYSDNKAPAGHYHMRVYNARIKGSSFHDIQDQKVYEKYYNPESYLDCQKLGTQAKKQSRDGIIYKSIRYTSGTNVAVLKPKAIIPPVKIHKILSYYWDGEKISMVNDLGKGRNLLIN